MIHERKYWSITYEFWVSDIGVCYNRFERRSGRRFLDWPTKWMNRPIFSLCWYERFKNKETTMPGDNKVKHLTWKCVSHFNGIIYLIRGRWCGVGPSSRLKFYFSMQNLDWCSLNNFLNIPNNISFSYNNMK